MSSTISSMIFLASVMLTSVRPISAQCLDWDDRFSLPGLSDPVHAAAVFDDGSGPALYLGGKFILAADVSASKIVRWDGVTWSAMGIAISGHVNTFIVWDDGSGPALFAGHDSGVRKWNGSSWTTLTGGSFTRTLSLFDDGAGAALYSAGIGVVQKWNGSSWSNIGSFDANVLALTEFDDGSGSALYAGGSFSVAGGVAAQRIAKWNGTSWSAVGTGVAGGPVESVCVFDDGSGPALFVGGKFTTAGGVGANRIAKWNGTTWSPLGTGLQGSGVVTAAYTLKPYDDGSGEALYVAGFFLTAGGVTANGIARWNGSSWSALSSGMNDDIVGLAEFDAGAGKELIACGDFTGAGGVAAAHAARWNGSSWSALTAGLGATGTTVNSNVEDSVASLTASVSGSALYIGGTFTAICGAPANNIAVWNGSTCTPLGEGITGPLDHGALGFTTPHVILRAIVEHDDGSGSLIHVAGNFSTAGNVGALRIARWNGTDWSALGSGMDAPVLALAPHDASPGAVLYAAGQFTSAGGVAVNRIAQWNGTSWSPVGTGMNEAVRALAMYDDGSGLALYAAGDFTDAGGVSASRVARWNGVSWSAVGVGMTSRVRALRVVDDGVQAKLYAGGDFTSLVGGASASRVAVWNGVSWAGVGSGLNAGVYALAGFDDGSGVALYAAGEFTGGGVVKLDGSSWSSLGTGLSGTPRDVLALAAFDDGTDGAPDLYVGGIFSKADGKPSSNIAQWHGCPPGTAYCFGDGIDPVVTAMCPCGNFGDPEHGCGNSVFTSGARLIASGKKSPNTVLFTLSNVPNNALATGFRNSTSNPTGAVFGDGVRCQTGALLRFGSHNTGTAGDAPNTWTAGVETVSPGLTRYYLVQYRNSSGFCPPETFNVSHGYSMTW